MRRMLAVAALVPALLYMGTPVARAVMLVATTPFHGAPRPPASLDVRPVRFRASDGTQLHGWLLRRRSAGVVLIPGFKADSLSMVPYARWLGAAGYTVLLYDSRGTGGSGGSFSLGVHEVDDVRGAVTYLQGVGIRRVALLGVSLGAGDAIVEAAGDRRVAAVVADSVYVDQRATVDRLDSLRLGPLRLPLVPLAPWTVDRLLGAPLADFSPLRAVRHIAPRPLLLIHSRHDANPTTPLAGARELCRRAGAHAWLWIAPRGGHAGALAGQPARYQALVKALLGQALVGHSVPHLAVHRC